MIDPHEKPGITTETSNYYTNNDQEKNNDKQNGIGPGRVMINGKWVEVQKAEYFSYTITFLWWYRKAGGIPLYPVSYTHLTLPTKLEV
mgnify:CR=1 FL=1